MSYQCISPTSKNGSSIFSSYIVIRKIHTFFNCHLYCGSCLNFTWHHSLDLFISLSFLATVNRRTLLFHWGMHYSTLIHFLLSVIFFITNPNLSYSHLNRDAIEYNVLWQGFFLVWEELCSFKWPTQYKSNLHVPHVKGHSINYAYCHVCSLTCHQGKNSP